jgi:hypothetical protein
VSALVGQIGDAIVTALNAAGLSQAFVALRAWRGKVSLTTLGALKVLVLPGPARFDPMDRRRDDSQYAFDVVLLVKCNPDDNAEVDPYVQLMEEIQEYFRGKILAAGIHNAICRLREFVNPGDTLLDDSILSDSRAFVGAVRLHWQLLQ